MLETAREKSGCDVNYIAKSYYENEVFAVLC
jgi:hypothetical protein